MAVVMEGFKSFWLVKKKFLTAVHSNCQMLVLSLSKPTWHVPLLLAAREFPLGVLSLTVESLRFLLLTGVLGVAGVDSSTAISVSGWKLLPL